MQQSYIRIGWHDVASDYDDVYAIVRLRFPISTPLRLWKKFVFLDVLKKFLRRKTTALAIIS
jgi:hypothetical protein